MHCLRRRAPIICHITKTMSTQVLKEIFFKSVESVQPQNLISSQFRVLDSHLVIKNETHVLQKPCYIVGFGKAVLGMATELEKLLATHLEMGIVAVPKGISEKFKPKSRKIKFVEGARDNIPDEDALNGAKEIRDLVEGLGEEDTLLVLISGGGSALFPLPIPPITLREKQALIKELSKKGADILELNCVRKQISALKGGGLATLAHPAKVISLVLSDIVGDPLEFIASGPTRPNEESAEDAINVMKTYGCWSSVAASVRDVLEGRLGALSKPKNLGFAHVTDYVIGNNRIAAEAARLHARSLGFQSAIISTSIAGDVKKISQIYADLACNMADAICNSSSKQLLDFAGAANLDLAEVINFDFGQDLCLIGAGEPTVAVTGTGKGGRNQQLALELLVRLNKLNIKSADISFLSGGTDGIDGPTDAAGAIATLDLLNNSRDEAMGAEDYLNNNDAYGFYSRFSGGDYLIKIGHTGTNVMDIHIMLVQPKN